jgi:hypothetical protein
MSTPRAGTTTQTTVRPPLKPERTETGRASPDTASPRKPTGPVTYKIEKGSNVWPGFR